VVSARGGGGGHNLLHVWQLDIESDIDIDIDIDNDSTGGDTVGSDTFYWQ
jgi:hypothetical protein